MKTKLLSLAVVLFVSCTSDDPASLQNANLQYYTVESQTSYYDGQPDYGQFSTGNIVNGKMHSLTSEQFFGGEGQGQETIQHYFYTGGLLSSVIFGDDIKNFYYDGSGNLIGIEWQNGMGNQHYRFVHQPGNVVYYERLNLPFDDPNAQIDVRYIAAFDASDNLVASGRDNDLDGVADNLNTLVYENNNLIEVQLHTGDILNYDYSDIIDTYSELCDNTYGRKVRRLMCADVYAGGFTNLPDYNLGHSANVTVQGAAEQTYTVLPTNYYRKKIELSTGPSWEQTVTREFFFE